MDERPNPAEVGLAEFSYMWKCEARKQLERNTNALIRFTL